MDLNVDAVAVVDLNGLLPNDRGGPPVLSVNRIMAAKPTRRTWLSLVG